MTSVRSSAFAAPEVSWDDAIADYNLLVKGTREKKTASYYRSRLSVLKKWADEQGLTLLDFRARHMRQYLADRADKGVADGTRRHDALVARAFLKFCKSEGYIDADPLVGYQSASFCPSTTRSSSTTCAALIQRRGQTTSLLAIALSGCIRCCRMKCAGSWRLTSTSKRGGRMRSPTLKPAVPAEYRLPWSALDPATERMSGSSSVSHFKHLSQGSSARSS
ncbi:MAG: site-specific integrase [Capsulimonadaceae bacterium]|nr:site-specific integrase [Capsulimonadaceae bacterium]